MISLNQIRLLEQRVESILQLVERLKNEKSVLEKENADLKSDSQRLYKKCADLEEAEGKIEEGILSVLNRLNDMEDAIQNASSDKEPVPPSQPVKAEAPTDERNTASSAAENMHEQTSTPQAAMPEENLQAAPNAQLDIF